MHGNPPASASVALLAPGVSVAFLELTGEWVFGAFLSKPIQVDCFQLHGQERKGVRKESIRKDAKLSLRSLANNTSR